MKQHKPLSDWTSLESLPKTVTVDGKQYPIRWDFTTALRFMDYVDRSDDEDEIFIKNVLSIWYPRIPDNTDEALTQAIKFYCGGDLPGEGYYTPAFSPSEDHSGLYAEFWERFGLDLTRDSIHWWVFRRLLKCLKERRMTP
ncbi:MAG: hypothetical protein IIY12_04635 [Clostridia bacterium]|nr:hypothetical protein [Clostridia bacterium]MBQ1965714.1 hypothetical protein [Clostridia bacterium]